MMFEMWPEVDWTKSRLPEFFLSNHSGKLWKKEPKQSRDKKVQECSVDENEYVLKMVDLSQKSLLKMKKMNVWADF